MLRHAHLSTREKNLSSLSPLSILQRGYALIIQPDGGLVRSVSQVKPGDPLTIRLQDGSFPALVGRQETGQDE
jgi:exodeoxyribonuclease VII large subunit